MKNILKKMLVLIPSLFFPFLANAHIGFGATTGALAGFLHPFNGLDHLLAMVGVGLWAAQMGGRSRWFVPGSFVLSMLIGGLLAVSGVALLQVETGILLSVLVMGLLIAMTVRLPLIASMVVVGIFGLFHGHAHGTEISLGHEFLTYAVGFVSGTALLHASGALAGMKLRTLKFEKAIPVCGVAIAVAGVWLAV